MKKRIRGKVVGTLLGFVFGGGPVGAALGFAVGHAHDNRQDDGDMYAPGSPDSFGGNPQQTAFITGIIVLGAKMAKADGRVTREEIEAFKRVFNVHEAQAENVGRLFDQARRSAEGFEPYAVGLAAMFRGRPAVLEEVLSGLFIIAAADSGGLSPAELRFLERVASIFNFGPVAFGRIAARSGVRLGGANRTNTNEEPIKQAYAILGLREEASMTEIKTTYHALIRKHHPDKLVAQGMAPEFIATATEKMKRINAAYEDICKARGTR